MNVLNEDLARSPGLPQCYNNNKDLADHVDIVSGSSGNDEHDLKKQWSRHHHRPETTNSRASHGIVMDFPTSSSCSSSSSTSPSCSLVDNIMLGWKTNYNYNDNYICNNDSKAVATTASTSTKLNKSIFGDTLPPLKNGDSDNSNSNSTTVSMIQQCLELISMHSRTEETYPEGSDCDEDHDEDDDDDDEFSMHFEEGEVSMSENLPKGAASREQKPCQVEHKNVFPSNLCMMASLTHFSADQVDDLMLDLNQRVSRIMKRKNGIIKQLRYALKLSKARYVNGGGGGNNNNNNNRNSALISMRRVHTLRDELARLSALQCQYMEILVQVDVERQASDNTTTMIRTTNGQGSSVYYHSNTPPPTTTSKNTSTTTPPATTATPATTTSSTTIMMDVDVESHREIMLQLDQDYDDPSSASPSSSCPLRHITSRSHPIDQDLLKELEELVLLKDEDLDPPVRTNRARSDPTLVDSSTITTTTTT